MALNSELSPLVALPSESLMGIIHFLEIQPLDLGNELPDAEFRTNRTALYNLCLTNRRLLAAARPSLYRSIILFCEDREYGHGYFVQPPGLVLLLRTLVECPELRPLVLNLAVSINPGLFTKVWHEHAHEFQTLNVADQALFDTSGLTELPLVLAAPTTSGSKRRRLTHPPPRRWHPRCLVNAESHMFGQVVAVISCMVPAVETLLLQGAGQVIEAIDHAFRDMLSNEETRSSMLRNLRTIQFQYDPGRFHRSHAERNYHEFGCSLPATLYSFPKLRRVDIWHGIMPTTPVAWDCLERLEVLNLDIIWQPRVVSDMLKKAVSLKSLSLTLSSDELNPEGPDLNEALLARAETLRVFKFREVKMTAVMRSLGHERRLWCLPQLVHLESLSVELPYLFGSSANMKSLGLESTLPPNLKTLELALALAWRFEEKYFAREWLAAFKRLMRYRSESNEAFQQLRHVQLAPSPDSNSRDWAKSVYVGRTRDLLRDNGITFEVSQVLNQLPRTQTKFGPPLQIDERWGLG